MPEIAAASLVAQIHAAPLRMVLAMTGGGSRAIADLLEVPGGSRTLLEAVVPYSAAALREWLGAPPEHYCSAQTARAMAVAAFLRAKTLSETGPLDDADLVGIACTASLASDRPKRGPHRIHVAWQRISAIATHSIELVKGRRSRAEEEELAARLILNAVAEAAGIADRVPLGNSADEPLVIQRTDAPAAWQDLLRGTIEAVRHEAGSIETAGRQEPHGERTRRVMFPGAFNPLHDGHRQMAEVAAAIFGQPIEFEISIVNVDKPPLDFAEMQQRTRAIRDWASFVVYKGSDVRAQGGPVSRDDLRRRRRHDPPHRRPAILRRRPASRRGGHRCDSADTEAGFSFSAGYAATVSNRLINSSCPNHCNVFAGKSPPNNSARTSRPLACAIRTKNERDERRSVTQIVKEFQAALPTAVGRG